jgi:sortase (surface protein transpeptidase)
MPVDMVSNGQIKTQGAVFRNLYKVEVGDTIALWQHHQRYLYRVDAVQILPEHGESLAVPAENAVCRDETGFERLTLVSCWPEWSNTYCVVTASLLRTADSR